MSEQQRSAGPVNFGPPNQDYPAPAPGPDVLALLGLVFAFVFWPAGLVLSILGLRHTRGTADRTGYGLALAGLVTSLVLAVASLVFFGLWLLAALAILHTGAPAVGGLVSSMPVP
jgi:hypothetical protein